MLLASASAAHPNGLANGSDQVGRNYMFHTLTAMVSLTAAPVDSTFPKTLAVNDFYWRDPRGGFDYADGAHPASGIHDRPDAGGRGLRLAAAGAGPRRLPNAIAARLLRFW